MLRPQEHTHPHLTHRETEGDPRIGSLCVQSAERHIRGVLGVREGRGGRPGGLSRHRGGPSTLTYDLPSVFHSATLGTSLLQGGGGFSQPWGFRGVGCRRHTAYLRAKPSPAHSGPQSLRDGREKPPPFCFLQPCPREGAKGLCSFRALWGLLPSLFPSPSTLKVPKVTVVSMTRSAAAWHGGSRFARRDLCFPGKRAPARTRPCRSHSCSRALAITEKGRPTCLLCKAGKM